MTFLHEIRSQKNAIRYLTSCLDRDAPSGSYLFTGPRGTGRAITAKAFILELICTEAPAKTKACGVCPTCKKIDKMVHPDVVWIKPEKNKGIKIEEIRSLRNTFSLKPYEAEFNVCVIEDAEMLTSSAANALLKILEEWPGRSVFILITDKKELLLPTVVSRCREVRFSQVSLSDTKDIIMENSEVSEQTASFLAHFSQGAPGRALEMVNEDIEVRKQEILAAMENIINEDEYVCLNWPKEGKDYLIEDIEMMILFFRDIVMGAEGIENMMFDESLMKTGTYRFFRKRPVKKIYEIIERLINMKLALTGSVNPKLAAQVLPAEIMM